MLSTAKRPAIKHRIKGRPALVRSLLGLLVRCHRFGAHRAITDADIRWCAAVLDALTAAADVAQGREDRA